MLVTRAQIPTPFLNTYDDVHSHQAKGKTHTRFLQSIHYEYESKHCQKIWLMIHAQSSVIWVRANWQLVKMHIEETSFEVLNIFAAILALA